MDMVPCINFLLAAFILKALLETTNGLNSTKTTETASTKATTNTISTALKISSITTAFNPSSESAKTSKAFTKISHLSSTTTSNLSKFSTSMPPTLQTNTTSMPPTLPKNTTSISPTIQTNVPSMSTTIQTNAPSMSTTIQTNVPSMSTTIQTNVPSMSTTIQTNAPSMSTTIQTNAPSMSTTIQTNAPSMSTTIQTNAPSMSTTMQTNAPSMSTTMQTNAPSMSTTIQTNAPSMSTTMQKNASSLASSTPDPVQTTTNSVSRMTSSLNTITSKSSLQPVILTIASTNRPTTKEILKYIKSTHFKEATTELQTLRTAMRNANSTPLPTIKTSATIKTTKVTTNINSAISHMTTEKLSWNVSTSGHSLQNRTNIDNVETQTNHGHSSIEFSTVADTDKISPTVIASPLPPPIALNNKLSTKFTHTPTDTMSSEKLTSGMVITSTELSLSSTRQLKGPDNGVATLLPTSYVCVLYLLVAWCLNLLL